MIPPLVDVLVLVIADDTDTRKALTLWVQARGAEVNVAVDVDGVVESLSNDRRPHVIVCDLDLVDEDCRDFLKRLREQPSLRKIPVILLTSDEAYWEQLAELGFEHRFLKPVAPGVITDAVVEVTRRRRKTSRRPPGPRAEQPPLR